MIPHEHTIEPFMHVSESLVSVWTTLRQSQIPLTTADIVAKTRLSIGTVRRHLRIFAYRGLVERYETWPLPLYEIADDAETCQASHFQHLERIVRVFEEQQQQFFT